MTTPQYTSPQDRKSKMIKDKKSYENLKSFNGDVITPVPKSTLNRVASQDKVSFITAELKKKLGGTAKISLGKPIEGLNVTKRNKYIQASYMMSQKVIKKPMVTGKMHGTVRVAKLDLHLTA